MNIKTQKEVREMFWEEYPEFERVKGWSQNDYHVDVRCAFCNFVDYLHRNGDISDALAQRVTL
jgi:hypothetical protein